MIKRKAGEIRASILQPSLHPLKPDGPARLRGQRRREQVGQRDEQPCTWGLLPRQSPRKPQHRHLQRGTGQTLTPSSHRFLPLETSILPAPAQHLPKQSCTFPPSVTVHKGNAKRVFFGLCAFLFVWIFSLFYGAGFTSVCSEQRALQHVRHLQLHRQFEFEAQYH